MRRAWDAPGWNGQGRATTPTQHDYVCRRGGTPHIASILRAETARGDGFLLVEAKILIPAVGTKHQRLILQPFPPRNATVRRGRSLWDSRALSKSGRRGLAILSQSKRWTAAAWPWRQLRTFIIPSWWSGSLVCQSVPVPARATAMAPASRALSTIRRRLAIREAPPVRSRRRPSKNGVNAAP